MDLADVAKASLESDWLLALQKNDACSHTSKDHGSLGAKASRIEQMAMDAAQLGAYLQPQGINTNLVYHYALQLCHDAHEPVFLLVTSCKGCQLVC